MRKTGIKQRRIISGQQVLALPGVEIPQVGEGLLWCPDCQGYLPEAAFHQGRSTYCIAHTRARQRANVPKYRRTARTQHLRRAYGITHEQYDAMFAAQEGRCAACGQAETKRDNRTGEIKWLCVDHDHDTGAVRGLLCVACNSALGQLQEDPARIRALLAYAERIQQDRAA